MKRFFILLFVCVAGYFLAPFVMENMRQEKDKVENRGTYTSGRRPIYKTMENMAYSHEVPVTTVSIVLNLSEVEMCDGMEKLFTVHTNYGELGLLLTKKGLVGNWQGNPWGERVPLSKLTENTNVVSVGDNDALALSVIVNGSTNRGDKNPGVTIVDASGEVVASYPGLNSYHVREYQVIDLDKRLVSHAKIHPRFLSTRMAGRRAAELEKAAMAKPGNPIVVYGGGAILIVLLAMLWVRLCPDRTKKRNAGL